MFFPPQPFSLAFLVLSLLFYDCGKGIDRQEELIFSLPSEPISLDPIRSTDLSSRTILKYLYPSLFSADRQGKITPALAKSYRVLPGSSDGTRILEITIHPSKAADGKSIDANVVLASLNRLRNISGPKRSAYSFLTGGGIKNSHTVSLSFRGGLREALEKLALPQAAIYCGPPEKGCGDFSLKEWKRNNFLRLTANDNRSTAIAPELLFRILPQATTGIFLYTKGQLDLMRLPNFLLRNGNVKEDSILVRKGGGVQYIAINGKEPCFDRNFRKAINYAIDKRTILKVLLEGKGEVSIGPFPRSIAKEFLGSDIEELYPYNIQKAKYFLEKSACYPEILEKELDFRMRGDEENQANGSALARYLRDIGLKVKIHPMEKAPLYKENGEGKGDLTLLFWYADLPLAWNFIDPLFAGDRFGNGGNRSFYFNKEMEDLLTEVRRADTMNLASFDRKALAIVGEDAPWIFLWSPYELYLTGDRIRKLTDRLSDLP
ncbi:ABC transporter, substrate-binding protein, family 5 [Leptospira inadai serovar Lyme str. 10]|uniref:ABC transporter, substrate-binding protein, family 5 n=2 Tax=Leptospira inadai serovar Lyme TaxID=293084 RepID=V6HRF3_9LEPT|nr:ABC transporter substrate-binding protein [Leptospira inadai]EQA35099.1 ABC transporter, substrate-binding protein, family 5 [Leptospira inadai serovar Lyme str. 10]PNV74160.1 ABC transporter substrate-binding protein [Leptospira inadai serovar Lyme]